MAKEIRALIIANKTVFPALDGGSLAIKKLSKILSRQNYIIDIVAISKNNSLKQKIYKKTSFPDKKITQFLFEKNMSFNILNFFKSIFAGTSYQANRFYDVEIRDFIKNILIKRTYSMIVFESVFTMVYLNSLHFQNQEKIIFRAHNIEHKIWKDLSNNNFFKKIGFLLLAKQIKKMETEMPKNVDYILTLSKKDKQYFEQLFPQKTYNIPVSFETDYPEKEKIINSIVHLGAMDWKPNVEGIDWFVKYVLPIIVKKNKNIKIYIAGKNMPKNYFNYINKNTIVEGKIEDAKQYISNKEIMFVPLFSGSGIRIKILESMSLGIPIISTSKGAEGIPYTNNENILIANTPEEFQKAICNLIKNKKLATKIGGNGKKLIELNFSNNFVINELNKYIIK